MRPHPISPVTEPLQYRAIGVVRGTYVPADADQLTRGVIRTDDGDELEAVVLGRLLTLMRRHLDLALPHLWVVYPRCREEGGLHLQMVGVWEPSTLAATQVATERPAAAGPEAELPEAETAASAAVADAAAVDADAADAVPAAEAAAEPAAAEPASAPLTSCGDALPEGDNYFSVRGELVYTRPEDAQLVVKVRQLPRADGQRPAPFKIQLSGAVPLEHLRHFVSLQVRREGQQLQVQDLEVIAPVAQRGNRGGKGRRDGRRGGAAPRGGGAGRSGAGGAGGGARREGRDGRSAPEARSESRPGSSRSAISRPSR